MIYQNSTPLKFIRLLKWSCLGHNNLKQAKNPECQAGRVDFALEQCVAALELERSCRDVLTEEELLATEDNGKTGDGKRVKVRQFLFEINWMFAKGVKTYENNIRLNFSNNFFLVFLVGKISFLKL